MYIEKLQPVVHRVSVDRKLLATLYIHFLCRHAIEANDHVCTAHCWTRVARRCKEITRPITVERRETAPLRSVRSCRHTTTHPVDRCDVGIGCPRTARRKLYIRDGTLWMCSLNDRRRSFRGARVDRLSTVFQSSVGDARLRDRTSISIASSTSGTIVVGLLLPTERRAVCPSIAAIFTCRRLHQTERVIGASYLMPFHPYFCSL